LGAHESTSSDAAKTSSRIPEKSAPGKGQRYGKNPVMICNGHGEMMAMART